MNGLRASVRLWLLALATTFTVLTIGLATGLQYHFGQALARSAAEDLYATASSGLASELRGLARVNRNIIELLNENPVLRDSGRRGEHLQIFAGVLARNPLYYGIYLGAADGSLFEVINLESGDNARGPLAAKQEERWVIVSVTGADGGNVREYRYLDSALELRRTRREPTDYDATTRPWYTSAMGAPEVQVTAPYLFDQLGVPGRTVSQRMPGTALVVGIDMTLDTTSAYLAAHRAASDGEIFMFTGDGEVVASSRDQDWAPGPGTPASAEARHRVPDPLFMTLAADPDHHGHITDLQLDGYSHLAWAAPVGDDENPLYLGILADRDKVIAPFLDKVLLATWITAGILLLLLPLAWFLANPIVRPIRRLAQENDKVRRRDYDAVLRVDSSIAELDDLSGSMVGMVSAIQAYENDQRTLMDAIIELIAQAIDDKSSYTGGHCERVPELAFMLAECASASSLPAFRDFRLETEEQWREYRIAAWLHDCGKITTPEHIVDKGSKLETIYNRIHEVRTRFEVLWRDAHIDYLEALLCAPGRKEELAGELQQRQRELQQDYAFVASCNVGGESLREEDVQRLRQIAGRHWTRHFDRLLGLSPAEEQRLAVLPAEQRPAPAPAQEPLLENRAEHIIPREQSTAYPPQFGIDMETPQHLYNLGEIYNLSVSRGTLTAEDRFKINEHMISTIKMLESLPFPQELRNVPRYASTHHETMSGTGYPRRLPGTELSVGERILAIADVFEALTAADRPYKKAKPLGEALDIMQKMVRDNHLDSDCFELFVREGIYRRYAEQFLAAEQIEDVDTSRYFHR